MFIVAAHSVPQDVKRGINAHKKGAVLVGITVTREAIKEIALFSFSEVIKGRL